MDDVGAVARADAWIRARPWVTDAALAAVLAVLLLPMSIPTVVESSWPTAGRGSVIAALLIGHAALAFRRTAPAAAFAVVSAMCLILAGSPGLTGPTADEFGTAVPPILLPSTLLFPVVLYTVAACGTERQSRIAAVVAAIGALIVVIRFWIGGVSATAGPIDGWLLFLIPTMIGCTVAPWSLGRLRRVHRRYIDSREELARSRERALLAREIHDVVSHSLAVMVSQAEGGRMMAAVRPEVARTALDTIAETGREAMSGMHSLLDTIDPTRAAQDAAPQPALADIEAVVTRVRSSGLPVEFAEHGATHDDSPRLGAAAELTAYRVVQESLTNVLKHAPAATRVVVALHWAPDALVLTVRNDGAAVSDLDASDRDRAGRGVPGMRRRVEAVAGILTAGPTSVDCFEVCATIPRVEAR